MLENGNYLHMTYQLGFWDFSFLTFNDVNGDPFGSWILARDSAIQIVTPQQVALLTWSSWDHMPLEDCTHHWFPPDDGGWSHLNSIEMVDGQIIASFRGCNRILSIDPSTGQVNWRIGPTNLSDAEWESRGRGPVPMDIIGDPQKQFCGQHAAQILPNGNLLMYDNGSDCSRNPWTGVEFVRPSRTYSRAVEYFLDFESNEAVYVREHSLYGTKNHIGWAAGNVAPLDNGGWLISWGFDIFRGNGPPPTPPPFSVDVDITEVDPSTGQELLTLDWYLSGREVVRATTMPPYALARQPRPLTAELPVNSATSEFHTGPTDRPQVVVAFPRPIVDFDETSPSLSVQGATVESVSPHLVDGGPAYSYVVTLAPDSDGSVTFRLLTGQACSSGGICAADGTMLSRVPAALVIGPHVTVSFAQASYNVSEGSARSIQIRLSAAYQGVRGLEIPVSLGTGATASSDDFTYTESVTLAAGETTKLLTVRGLDDTLVEGDESVTLEFGRLPDGVFEGTQASTTVVINDTDQANIDFAVGQDQVAEGGSTQISFTITNGVTYQDSQLISLSLGGTATPNDDFVLVDEVTLFTGAASADGFFFVIDDTDIESGRETVVIRATIGSDNASLGSRTITIPPATWPASRLSPSRRAPM